MDPIEFAVMHLLKLDIKESKMYLKTAYVMMKSLQVTPWISCMLKSTFLKMMNLWNAVNFKLVGNDQILF